MKLPWIIVGYGRVGQSLRLLASALDQPVLATWNRSAEALSQARVPSPEGTTGAVEEALASFFTTPCLLWLTVVDSAIEEVFARICPHLATGSIVVHTSGSLSSQILRGRDDLATASLHPLQAITDPQKAYQRFARTHWTIEGDTDAVDYLLPLLSEAGIHPVKIAAEDKTLYHASAVTAANLLVSLFDAALAMAEAAHIDAETARAMLIELTASSVENLRHQPPKQALSGPVARGDLKTIEAHKRALQDHPELLAIYEMLTERALRRLT